MRFHNISCNNQEEDDHKKNIRHLKLTDDNEAVWQDDHCACAVELTLRRDVAEPDRRHGRADEVVNVDAFETVALRQKDGYCHVYDDEYYADFSHMAGSILPQSS